MTEYEDFLRKIRKKNGEKYLPKTIQIYSLFIEKHQEEFLKSQNISELILYMNKQILNYRNPTMKGAFKTYLMFIGVPEGDERLKLLKSSKKIASALTSLRVLSEKVISKNDMKLLYDSVEEEWKLIIGFLYDTAIRESEFLNVRWKDITFKESSNIFAEVRILGKGSKIRTVFLSEMTVVLLKKLRPNIKDIDKVFEFRMKNGKLYMRQEKILIDGLKKRTKEIIGVAHSPHHIRHSRSQDLANSGGDVGGISNLLGHTNYSTTQIYIKSSSAIAKKMIEKYSEGLDEQKEDNSNIQ